MTLATWLAFCLATILLCFSPGPGALSSMSAGMKYGWRRGMWNCLGMQASIIVNSTIIALAEDGGTLEDVVEPYLIQQGFVMRTARGRIATPQAWGQFGLTMPESLRQQLGGVAS